MTLIDFRRASGFRGVSIFPSNAVFEVADDAFLGIDDILSRGGDDLGLDVDKTGHLVLVEGKDFD